MTEICLADDLLAVERTIRKQRGRESFTYHVRNVVNPFDGTHSSYNLLPVILDKHSVPWELGTLFILSRLEAESLPNMVTIKSLADDLGAFKEWLDSHDDPDGLLISFPVMKLRRVTYRYRGSLKIKIEAGEIAVSTAKRRIGTVVGFYRWMIDEKLFEPTSPPWDEQTYSLGIKNSYGRVLRKTVRGTDLKFKTSIADDPFSGVIQDEGRLRPLSAEEQRWVMEAANALGNGEMYFLLLFMLATGARLQTAATLRLRHFTRPVTFSRALAGGGEVVKLRAGPGTGIDTKRDRLGVLQIPRSLFEALQTYAQSDRARHRRQMATGGDDENQYLFLTQQGSPYYTAKEVSSRFDSEFSSRHQKNGGTIRQFLKDRLIPYIQEKHSKSFHFRPHDLRATFGMNQTDLQMALVSAGIITLNRARTNVMALMWHTSLGTTDKYLDYRKQMEVVYAAVNGYGDNLQGWIAGAMKGVDDRNQS